LEAVVRNLEALRAKSLVLETVTQSMMKLLVTTSAFAQFGAIRTSDCSFELRNFASSRGPIRKFICGKVKDGVD